MDREEGGESGIEEEKKKMDKEMRSKLRRARNKVRDSMVQDYLSTMLIELMDGETFVVSDNEDEEKSQLPSRETPAELQLDQEMLLKVKNEPIEHPFELSTDDEENQPFSDQEENVEISEQEENVEVSEQCTDLAKCDADSKVTQLDDINKTIKDIFGSDSSDEETNSVDNFNDGADDVEKKLEAMFGSILLNKDKPGSCNSQRGPNNLRPMSCANTSAVHENSSVNSIMEKNSAAVNHHLVTTRSRHTEQNPEAICQDSVKQKNQTSVENPAPESYHIKSENKNIPFCSTSVSSNSKAPNYTNSLQNAEPTSCVTNNSASQHSGLQRGSNNLRPMSCANTSAVHENPSVNSIMSESQKTVFVKKKGSMKRIFKTKLEPVVDLTSEKPVEKSMLRLEETVEIEDEEGKDAIYEILGTVHIAQYDSVSTTTTTTTTQSVKVEEKKGEPEEGEVSSSDEKRNPNTNSGNSQMFLLDNDDYADSLLESSTTRTFQSNSVVVQNNSQLQNSKELAEIKKMLMDLAYEVRRKHKKERKYHSSEKKYKDCEDKSNVPVPKVETIYVSDEEVSKRTCKSEPKIPLPPDNKSHTKDKDENFFNNVQVFDYHHGNIIKEMVPPSSSEKCSTLSVDYHHGNLKKEMVPPSSSEKCSTLSSLVKALLPSITSPKPSCSSGPPTGAVVKHHSPKGIRNYKSTKRRDSSKSSSSSSSKSPSRKRRHYSPQTYSHSSSNHSPRFKPRSPKNKKSRLSPRLALEVRRSRRRRSSSSSSSHKSSSRRNTHRSSRRYSSDSSSSSSSRSRSFSPRRRKTRFSPQKYGSSSRHRRNSKPPSREYRSHHSPRIHNHSSSFVKEVSVSRQMLSNKGLVQNNKKTITQVIGNQVIKQEVTTTTHSFNKDLESFKEAVKTQKLREHTYDSDDPLNKLDIRVYTEENKDVTRHRPDGDIYHPFYTHYEDREFYRARLKNATFYVQMVHEICIKNGWCLPTYFVEQSDGEFCFAMKLQDHRIVTTKKAAQKKQAKSELAKVLLQWMGIVDLPSVIQLRLKST